MTSISDTLPDSEPGVSPGIGETESPLLAGPPRPSLLQRYATVVRKAPVAPFAPTPTVNLHQPFRRGGFASLCAALDHAAGGDTGLNFYDARGTLLDALPYSRLRLEAQAFARGLIDAGVGRGERIVLVADTSAAFCVAFFGAQYAGVVPVPVSTPVGLGAKAGYVDQLRRQIVAADAIGLLAPPDLVAMARQAADGTMATLVGALGYFDDAPVSTTALRPFGADDACYVQFSSGSTRAPQGIDIRQKQLMANIDGSLAAQQIDEKDAGVSWLPFYHDMGLIGFVLAPLCAQRSVDLMSPHDFAKRPLQWLMLIARRRATITYSPSFGYDLVVRRAATKKAEDFDLSSLRLAGIGAEMIQPAVLDRFADAFAAKGFDRNAFMPSYGMAEVCVGLSFTPRMDGMKTDTFVDPETGRSRDFVVCGRVMDGHTVEIRDGRGTPLGQRTIGRVFVQGASVMPGYFRQAENKIESPVSNGWLDTGDLAYWCGDELVVTGRAKDLIIVNGRNVWPQDIEWAVEELPLLARGECCAFSVESAGTEKVVVMVETRPADAEAREALQGVIRQVVKESVGLDCDVVLVGRTPGLPRTSSGKLSRARARALFLDGSIPKSPPSLRLV